MIYKIKFTLNGKGFEFKTEADNEAMARQKFLQWISTKIVGIEPVNKATSDFLDFFNSMIIK